MLRVLYLQGYIYAGFIAVALTPAKQMLREGNLTQHGIKAVSNPNAGLRKILWVMWYTESIDYIFIHRIGK